MKQFIWVLLILLTSELSGQSGKVYLSTWNSDGSAGIKISQSEWTYQKKGSFYYFISNDADKIFINIRIQDETVQLRLLREGMKLWVNMDDKPVKNLGVHFPLGSMNSTSKGKRSEQLSTDAAEVSILTSLSKATVIELIGFKGEQSRLSADNPDSFSGSVKIDNNGWLNYYMILPIEKLPVRNSREGIGAMPFSFGVEFGIVAEKGKKTPTPVLVWIKSIKLATDK
jgi:hypothetical protein